MLPKIVWNSLLATPALLGTVLFASSSVIAADVQGAAEATETAVTIEAAQAPAVAAPAQVAPAETTVEFAAEAAPVEAPEAEAPVQLAQVPAAQPAPAAETTPSVDSLQQVMEYSSESESMDQVTSISQLSDVEPTDWAFQALQSLVERYGVIAGYPDGTYRGDRALTRFEFAAGLNAALDRVNELIAAGLADAVTREDLATLQRLQEEFAAELATLRGRVDALEARTAELEANQFSTTTVLRGRTIFSVQDIFGGGGEGVFAGFDAAGNPTRQDFIDEDETNTVFQSRVRLNFDTSFTGEDRLRARLQWGNFVDFVNTADAGVNPTTADALFAPQQALSYATNTSGDVRLGRLEYYFPLGDATTVYLEARGASISDIVSSVSSFDDPEQGSLSYFGYNPIYDINPGRGIGAGLTFDFGGNFQLGGGYLTGAGDDPSEGNGLFDGEYAAFGQLTYGLNEGPLVLALTYANVYRYGEVGGVPDANRFIINAYGASAQFNINDDLFVGGWVSYYDSDELDGNGDSETWTYAGTLGVANLGVEGSLLGLIVGVPPRTTSFEIGGSRSPIGRDRDGNQRFRDDASLHIEGFYRLPLTDNITITPGVIWVLDPGNNNDNDDFVTGVIRTSFSF
jgi:hypothetical protein